MFGLLTPQVDSIIKGRDQTLSTEMIVCQFQVLFCIYFIMLSSIGTKAEIRLGSNMISFLILPYGVIFSLFFKVYCSSKRKSPVDFHNLLVDSCHSAPMYFFYNLLIHLFHSKKRKSKKCSFLLPRQVEIVPQKNTP